MPFTLTPSQLDTFDADGFLQLPAFYSAACANLMAQRIWADMAQRYGLDPENPSTWTTERPFKWQALVKSGAFSGLDTPDLRALIDQLLGEGAWQAPHHWGQPLVTFANGQPWDVPYAAWHTDYPATAMTRPLPAVRFFVFLEPVLPRGAGTMLVRGSHLAMMKLSRDAGGSIRSADARQILQSRSAWLRALSSKADSGDREARFMEMDGDMMGFPVRVIQLTGAPGDMVLMHPGMLHGGGPNALPRPRMMLVQSMVRRDWMSAIRY